MRHFVLFMIRFYQRFLSPIKGYSCAYRVYTGKESCSGYGYRVIQRYGVIKGYWLLQRQFDRCADACEANRQRRNQTRPTAPYQAGFCDGGDISCDGGDLNCDVSDVCNDLSGCIPVPDPCDVLDDDDCESCRKERKKELKSRKIGKYQPLPDKI